MLSRRSSVTAQPAEATSMLSFAAHQAASWRQRGVALPPCRRGLTRAPLASLEPSLARPPRAHPKLAFLPIRAEMAASHPTLPFHRQVRRTAAAVRARVPPPLARRARRRVAARPTQRARFALSRAAARERRAARACVRRGPARALGGAAAMGARGGGARGGGAGPTRAAVPRVGARPQERLEYFESKAAIAYHHLPRVGQSPHRKAPS